MNAPPPDAPLPTRARPESPSDLFWAFTAIAMQGFGGVLAVVQRALVENKRWLTQEEFVEDWAVAQVLPGPNVINLSVILGDRYFGWRGALAALAGMLAFPTVIVLALALVYSHFATDPRLAGALRGMGAVAAGLIAATGIKLMPTLRSHPLGWRIGLVFTALVFGAIALLKWPLIGVLALFGSVACVWTYRRIAA
ncbi:chromate transporter [Variovorax dokdonensis]|uniref:Chromate transporter n=1 Tax=Variovorax dokdonensis TaxID=344883 RepID=A0ABT7NCU9_9BURK|nr:chromate transporter [Variovorax dokdonensis]MDM0045762.1 chromate transporter [Variovorax dokdonensis]